MEQKQVPHVVLIPFPAQGHINSLLKLAELVGLSGICVTFFNTEYNHKRLLDYANLRTRFESIPGFQFETISDGLPDDHSRSFNLLSDMLYSVKTFIQPGFRDMLISGSLNTGDRPPVSCIIADGIMTFTIDVAKEMKIPSISFRTPSAAYYWVTFCVDQLIQAGDVPFTDENMDHAIKSVPGMENFLRPRDLPSFCRAKQVNDAGLQLIKHETIKSTTATAHILNTFEDLEAPILSQLRSRLSKIYTIGPLHALLNLRRKNSSQLSTSSSNSLLPIDRSCMAWLDSQPPKSVVYVSFGSVIHMTHENMLEFWYGLVNSGKRFLWVIRPDLVTDREEERKVPEELLDTTKERGYMVDWCPQEEVLEHPAVGGFLTHSGWNSTLESIVAGLPMVCWPHFADQPVNSRYVDKVWNIGFDMKDTCVRSIVEKMVRDMMEDKREELMISVDRLAEKARSSITEGGSSYCNLDSLLEDIKSMTL